ncbi:GCN5 family acetyltransferase [Rhizobium sp. Root1240]
MVNAIDEEARLFWLRRGFLPSRDDPFRLMRPMADIAASLEMTGVTG